MSLRTGVTVDFLAAPAVSADKPVRMCEGAYISAESRL